MIYIKITWKSSAVGIYDFPRISITLHTHMYNLELGIFNVRNVNLYDDYGSGWSGHGMDSLLFNPYP